MYTPNVVKWFGWNILIRRQNIAENGFKITTDRHLEFVSSQVIFHAHSTSGRSISFRIQVAEDISNNGWASTIGIFSIRWCWPWTLLLNLTSQKLISFLLFVILSPCAKLHENGSWISEKSQQAQLITNKQTNKLTRVLTIPPGGGKHIRS